MCSACIHTSYSIVDGYYIATIPYFRRLGTVIPAGYPGYVYVIIYFDPYATTYFQCVNRLNNSMRFISGFILPLLLLLFE